MDKPNTGEAEWMNGKLKCMKYVCMFSADHFVCVYSAKVFVHLLGLSTATVQLSSASQI